MNHSKLSPTRLTDGSWLYLGCALISVLLFATSLYTDDIINDDGMDYIYAAYEYGNGNTAAALAFRPEQLFYSQFAILSKYTGLSLLQSAYTLSLLAQIALMCGFLAIIRSLGGSATIQLLAIMVIASMIHFNELRPHIVKGFGFWACQIWAIWAIINFALNSRWRYLLGWAALSIISMLFRIEGIVYLVGMALIIPLVVKGAPRKRFLLCGVAILAGCLAIASINHLYFKQRDSNQRNFNQESSQKISPSIKLKAELRRATGITDTINKQKELIRDTMPNKWARDSTSHFLIGGLIFEVAKVLLYTTSGLLLILVLVYGKATIFPKTINHKLIAGYFIIGLVISFYTVASRFFITDRYLFLPALLLCIPIPFLLEQILSSQDRQGWGRRYILRGAIFIIPILTILTPTLKDNDQKAYIPEAARWLKENLPPADSIYYNDQKLAFYSEDYANRSFQIPEISLKTLRNQSYRYAVIHTEKSKPLKISKLLTKDKNTQLVHSISGQRRGTVDVYKISAITE